MPKIDEKINRQQDMVQEAFEKLERLKAWIREKGKIAIAFS